VDPLVCAGSTGNANATANASKLIRFIKPPVIGLELLIRSAICIMDYSFTVISFLIPVLA
jgi:hypothetical protein